MSSPTRKLSANVPPEFFAMARARQAELPYRSENEYIMALVLHDCRFRPPEPHVYGLQILGQRGDKRAKDIERIVRDFESGVRPSERPPVHERMREMLVEEIAHLPARVRVISAKPAPRRR